MLTFVLCFSIGRRVQGQINQLVLVDLLMIEDSQHLLYLLQEFSHLRHGAEWHKCQRQPRQDLHQGPDNQIGSMVFFTVLP
jgi:hypothetical protein